MISVYMPGTSLLHRAPAGMKLAALLAFTTLLLVFRSPLAVAVGTIVVLLAYALGGFTPRIALAQVWPLRWIVLVLFPFQLWLGGWQAAVSIVGTLVLAVALAALVSLTTTTTDLLATLERILSPVRLLGWDPARIAFVLTLSIRVVPVIYAQFGDVRDARRARGLERSVRAYATPVVIRTIGYSRSLGDALVARGLDD
jgi:biotin transport system permease protein